MADGKISLREAHAIAYLLEHGRWPDAATAEWAESRVSKVALDYLLAARLRGPVSSHGLEPEEEAVERAHSRRGAA